VIAGAALSGSAAAADSVLKRFLSGVGPDAVGMVDASEDTEIAGPQAIYAGYLVRCPLAGYVWQTAHYLRGLVHLYLGDSAPAVSDLEYVALRDSRDAYAAYFYAQALLQSDRLELAR